MFNQNVNLFLVAKELLLFLDKLFIGHQGIRIFGIFIYCSAQSSGGVTRNFEIRYSSVTVGNERLSSALNTSSKRLLVG